MALLIASARQFSPTSDFVALGTRRLIDDFSHAEQHWVLYDTNPDQLREAPPHVHRLHLRSNSFHHQSVIVFSAGVIAGATPWFGPSMENFFGPLAKSTLPVWALGLREFPPNGQLSSDELRVLGRPGGIVTSPQPNVLRQLRSFGIVGQLLPCPSLFVNPLVIETSEGRDQLRIGWWLTEHERPAPDRELWGFIQRLAKRYDSRLLCATVDDFLKQAALFPNQAVYSYDPTDYLRWLVDCDLVITNDATAAVVANACHRPALQLTVASGDRLETLPYVSATTISELEGAIARCPGRALNRDIERWKNECRVQYSSVFNPSLANLGLASTVDQNPGIEPQ